jgi:hypothetical protein
MFYINKAIIGKSRGGRFYGTGIDIWAGFGPVGITEKKNWADYEQLFRPFFSSFHGQKKFKNQKHCSFL